MNVQLDDGRIIPFEDGITEEEAKAYLDLNYPREPNIAQRTIGHGLIGMGDLLNKVGNIADTFSLPKAVGEVSRGMGEVFTDRPMARQVTEHPETSWLGQAAGGLVEFAPQMPLYGGAGKLIFGAASKVPALAGAVQKIMPVAGEGILAGTARAIPRAAIEGLAVGTLAQPEGTDALTRLGRGAVEGAEFAAATAVLHPAFSLLGKMGRTLFRRYRDMGKVNEELAKKAETDPEAAEELAKLNETATVKEDLFVPKGEDTVVKEDPVVAKKPEQTELNLDPVKAGEISPEVLDQFKALDYTEADLVGMPAKQAELILEQGIKKTATIKAPVVESTMVVKREVAKVEGEGVAPIRTKEDIQSEIDDYTQELADHQTALKDAAGDREEQASIRENIASTKEEIALLKKELGSLEGVGAARRKRENREDLVALYHATPVASAKIIREKGFKALSGVESIRTAMDLVGASVDRRRIYLRSLFEEYYGGEVKSGGKLTKERGPFFTASKERVEEEIVGEKTKAESILNALWTIHLVEKDANPELSARAKAKMREIEESPAEIISIEVPRKLLGDYTESGDIELTPEVANKYLKTQAPSGKKFTKALPSVEDRLALNRMGYTMKEIDKMSAEEARANIDAVKNIPEPTADEIAKADIASMQVEEALLAREQSRIARIEMTSEERAANLEDIEKTIADAEVSEEPLSKLSEILIKADTIDDSTLTTLIDALPRTREDILAEFRRKVEQKKAVSKERSKEVPPQTSEELNKFLAGVRAKAEKGKARRSRKTSAELEAEADALLGEEFKDTGEPLAADEMMKEDVAPRRNEVDEDGGYTLDSLGFQQTYEKGVAFFSKLERAVKNKPFTKMPADQLKNMLKGMQVSEKEIDNVLGGLKGTVTKQDVLDEIKANGVQLKDVVLGDVTALQREKAAAGAMDYEESADYARANATQFSSYQEPGSVPGSYRELFVTAPLDLERVNKGKLSVGNMKSMTDDEVFAAYKELKNPTWNDGHSAYSDVQNPIVRIRYNDREVNGKKILFVEEIQGPSPTEQSKMPEALQKRLYDIGVKRVLALAKEGGYDGVAWTTGEMQASRYDLSKHIDGVQVIKHSDGTWGVVAEKNNQEVMRKGAYDHNLADLIGKDLAAKAKEDLKNKGTGEVFYSGLDLKVGGEGLKSVYDKTLPEKFKKYGKGEVGELPLTTSKNIYQLYEPSEFERVFSSAYTKDKPWGVESLSKDREEILDVIGFKTKGEADAYIKENSESIKVPYIPITSATPPEFSLYMNPIEPIYNWLKTLARSEKIKENASSRKLVNEVSGSKLTMSDRSRDIETTLQRIARVTRMTLGTPGYSHETPLVEGNKLTFKPRSGVDSEEMASHIYNLWERMSWGKFNASATSDVFMTAKSLLDTSESRIRIRGIIEKTITKDITPAEREAADLVIGELAAVREQYKDFLRIKMKEDMNTDMFAAFSEIISGRPKAEVVAKYKTHIVPDKLGRRRVRDWIDEGSLLANVKEYQDIDNWGLEDYVTKFELGNMRIISGGKLYARASSIEEASHKFTKLVERDLAEGVHRDYQIDNNFDLDALKTGMSKRGFNRMVNRLQNGLSEAVEGINTATARRLSYKALKDRFYINPSSKYSPFVETRRDLLQGDEDIFDTLPFYAYSMHMKMALDPAIASIRKAIAKVDIVGTEPYTTKDGTTKIREIKRPHFSKENSDYITQLIDDIKGREYIEDKVADSLLNKLTGRGDFRRSYSKVVQGARELQANLKMGYSPIKMVYNGASAIGYLNSKVGPANIAKGMEFMRTSEGKELIAATDYALGVNITESAMGDTTAKGTFEKIGLLKHPTTEAGRLVHAVIEPLGLFQAPELPIRRLTVATGYVMAKNAGLSDAAARIVAIKFNKTINFTYDMASLPTLLRGPTARLITQFKPFMLQSMQLMTTLRGDEWVRFLGMQLALAGPRGVNILLRSAPFIGALGGWDKIEEWMNKEYPRLSRGIGGFIGDGIDVSAPMTFQLPTTARDWYGPTLSNIGSLYNNLWVPLTEGKGVDGNDLLKAGEDTFPALRYWHDMIDQVITKDGWVKNERGQRMYHIDNTAAFVTRGVLGVQSLEENRIKAEERILTKRSLNIADQKKDVTDSIIDSIAKGQSITPSDLEDMIKLGIKPGALRRNLMYRNLTPMQRRLMNTEIIRRPEILEMYPDDVDLSQ